MSPQHSADESTSPLSVSAHPRSALPENPWFRRLSGPLAGLALAGLLVLGGGAGGRGAPASPLPAQASQERVTQSPWGPDDQIGTLNRMTDESRLEILRRVRSGKVYDLSVEYFVGMPSWYVLGDPRYQYHLTHTPHGTAVDDPMGVGRAMNEKVSYTGDSITMYTHMGTHIDALNHFGLEGKIYNGFSAHEHVGDRGWTKAGAEVLPPIVARGVLLDVAAAKGLGELPPSYRIMPDDLKLAADRQNTHLRPGDVVLVRTGRMKHFHEENSRYMDQPPGLGLDAARWLIEEQQAMTLGADNLSLETFPVETKDNWVPVHTYLLAERGVPFMEVVNLEELAKDGVHEFAFIGASLKLRGASGAPMRPIALATDPAPANAR